MSLIKNIESKIRLAFFVCIASFVTCIIICIISFSYANKMIQKERQQIYVLDKNISIVAQRSDVLDNREAEYKAHIAAFHDYFFSLPPDNTYIEKQLSKAMYLIDASGVAQYNSLKEKGYYNSIVSTSSIVTVTMDSIALDMNNKHWSFYGKQKIERPSMINIRSLVTEGYLQDAPRTINNPHGCLIFKWRTIENKDIFNEQKKIF